MSKVRLYLVRHGKTMFNTIGRAQGWSDTPLTAEGELGIHELGIGLRESGLQFDRAYSSDSGRTIQTMGIILEELGLQGKIPYRMDKRIREWCFGSFDGGYDGELFMGVMPRVFNIEHVHQLSYAELAEGLVEAFNEDFKEQSAKVSVEIEPVKAVVKEESTKVVKDDAKDGSKENSKAEGAEEKKSSLDEKAVKVLNEIVSTIVDPKDSKKVVTKKATPKKSTKKK